MGRRQGWRRRNGAGAPAACVFGHCKRGRSLSRRTWLRNLTSLAHDSLTKPSYILFGGGRADAVQAAVKPLQVLELLIFAALAAVVLFNLYHVLGRRMGRQPGETRDGEPQRPLANRLPGKLEEKPTPQLEGLATLRARDASFDPGHFLSGARSAYETIVKAYAAGDRSELRDLTTAPVYQAFESGITAREAHARTETVDFLQPPRADIEDVSLAGDVARVRVRFLAELRSRTKDAAGEAVDDRRTAELWTFERPVTNRDPNWALARVEAAQA